MCENNFGLRFSFNIINYSITCCCDADDVGVVFPKLPELLSTVEFVLKFGLVLRVEFWAGELPLPANKHAIMELLIHLLNRNRNSSHIFNLNAAQIISMCDNFFWVGLRVWNYKINWQIDLSNPWYEYSFLNPPIRPSKLTYARNQCTTKFKLIARG